MNRSSLMPTTCKPAASDNRRNSRARKWWNSMFSEDRKFPKSWPRKKYHRYLTIRRVDQVTAKSRMIARPPGFSTRAISLKHTRRSSDLCSEFKVPIQIIPPAMPDLSGRLTTVAWINTLWSTDCALLSISLAPSIPIEFAKPRAFRYLRTRPYPHPSSTTTASRAMHSRCFAKSSGIVDSWLPAS